MSYQQLAALGACALIAIALLQPEMWLWLRCSLALLGLVVLWFYHKHKLSVQATSAIVHIQALQKKVQLASLIEQLACDYDPSDVECLRRFQRIRMSTHCVFAAKSRYQSVLRLDLSLSLMANGKLTASTTMVMYHRLWGSRDWESHSTASSSSTSPSSSMPLSDRELDADAISDLQWNASRAAIPLAIFISRANAPAPVYVVAQDTP
jgi:hypothetical protein